MESEVLLCYDSKALLFWTCCLVVARSGEKKDSRTCDGREENCEDEEEDVGPTHVGRFVSSRLVKLKVEVVI